MYKVIRLGKIIYAATDRNKVIRFCMKNSEAVFSCNGLVFKLDAI